MHKHASFVCCLSDRWECLVYFRSYHLRMEIYGSVFRYHHLLASDTQSSVSAQQSHSSSPLRMRVIYDNQHVLVCWHSSVFCSIMCTKCVTKSAYASVYSRTQTQILQPHIAKPTILIQPNNGAHGAQTHLVDVLKMCCWCFNKIPHVPSGQPADSIHYACHTSSHVQHYSAHISGWLSIRTCSYGTCVERQEYYARERYSVSV